MQDKSFEELYKDILNRKVCLDEPLPPGYDPRHLDCLLHPEKYASVIYTESCSECSDSFERACSNSCVFDAIEESEDGKLHINPDKCTGCAVCVEACENRKLTAGRDILAAMKRVREGKGPAYALVAPAFLGQFGEQATAGKLRAAFQALGFEGMVEVALFADILTMKEALEFNRHIHQKGDFQLTSCCCPVWIAMIRKVYNELLPHVPGAVSPMVACGRVVKRLHPDAVTVFVGPCMAKKSEAREPDIADAVDYVLTFQEVKDIFEAAHIHPETLPESEKDHSSGAGRMYAYTGGVSEAVKITAGQLKEDGTFHVEAEQADGIQGCRQLLARLMKGEVTANFFEGMGCAGGCVGGPRAILDREQGRKNVEGYVQEAAFKTPLENPYVMKLMEKLGFGTVEELLEDESLFVRRF